MAVATRDVSMDTVKQEAPDDEFSNDSESCNSKVSQKTSCDERLSTIKQELAESHKHDVYVCRNVESPFLNNEDSMNTSRAVKVEPIDIEFSSSSVAQFNIKIEPKQEVVEGSRYKLDVSREVAGAGTDAVDTLVGTTVQPVLEFIKCEIELIQGLDDPLSHQSLRESTRTVADLLSPKGKSVSKRSNNKKDESSLFKSTSKAATKQRLKKHTSAPTGTKPFQCNQCEFATHNKQNLKNHGMVHSGIRPYRCDKCNYSTSRKRSLKYHSSRHTAVKPFHCDQCEFSSHRKCNLDSHMLVHSNIKPFQCDLCSYKTAYKHSLKLHITTHTGVKRFKCHLCGYAINKESDLTIHLNAHAGIKPFRCDQCSFCATSKRVLKKHTDLHNGLKPFKCDQCVYSAATIRTLTRHTTRHHSRKIVWPVKVECASGSGA